MDLHTDGESQKLQAKDTDRKLISMIILLLLLAFIGLMNRYRYEHIHSAESREQIVRISRFTGQICYSQNDGSWNSNRFMTRAQQDDNDIGARPLSEYSQNPSSSVVHYPKNLCE
jgi:hypothetical protein